MENYFLKYFYLILSDIKLFKSSLNKSDVKKQLSR